MSAAIWAEAWSPGATVQPLAGGWIGNSLATSATLTLQRLTLPTGASLPLTAPGPVDLAVETGVLTLDVRGGLVWQQSPKGQNQGIASLRAAALLPGDAALLQDAASVTLLNEGRGPLVVLALSVEPDRDDPATSRPTPLLVVTLDLRADLSARYQPPTPAATPDSSPRQVLHVGAAEQPPWNDAVLGRT